MGTSSLYVCLCVRKQCSFNKLYTTENQWRGDSHEAAAQKWNRSALPRDRWHLIFLSAIPGVVGRGGGGPGSMLRLGGVLNSNKQSIHLHSLILS